VLIKDVSINPNYIFMAIPYLFYSITDRTATMATYPMATIIAAYIATWEFLHKVMGKIVSKF
jgi:hypothetical protein